MSTEIRWLFNLFTALLGCAVFGIACIIHDPNLDLAFISIVILLSPTFFSMVTFIRDSADT